MYEFAKWLSSSQSEVTLISLKDEECCLQFAVAQLASRVPPKEEMCLTHPNGGGVQRLVLASFQECTGRVC